MYGKVQSRGRGAAIAKSRGWRWPPVILFWAGFVLFAFGFVSNTLWRDIPLDPGRLLAELALASVVGALVLWRLLRCSFATAMLAVWLVALACLAGFASSVAVLLIASGALAIGSCIVPEGWQARVPLSLLAGFALMAGVVGWTLPFHIDNLRAVYAGALVLLVAWRWRVLVEMLRPVHAAWSEAVAAAQVPAALAVLTLGVVSTCAWLPTILFDDLSYHIGLPSQLVRLGYYRMAAGSNVWALAGWSADVLHGIAWVVAGAESRGAVDALWFAASSVLVWRLCEALELGAALRWLAVALFASMPELAYTLASMQTEGPTIAVMLGLALLIQRSRSAEPRELKMIAILFGLLLGLKVSNLWFALPLGLWLLWQWRARLPWRVLPVSLLLMVIVAGSSYVYAWVLTGNPVLPIFNGIFHSPYFPPVNFSDPRWHTGFGWDIVWRVVFHSSAFDESGAKAAPFALIALGGCFLVALARPRSRALALVAATAFLLPLSIIQYLRYATPGLALVIPVMLCGLPAPGGQERHRQMQAVFLWLLVPVTLAFMTGVCWQFRSGVLQTFLTDGKTGVFAKFAPTRSIAEWMRVRDDKTARILMLNPSQPFAAEMDGRAFDGSWYDPTLSRLIGTRESANDDSKWIRLFDLTGANYVVTSSNTTPTGLFAAIANSKGTLAYTIGGEDLWALHAGKPGAGSEVANNGLAVTFDTADAPARQTLVDGELEIACDPLQASKGHIAVGWTVILADGGRVSRNGWAQCTPGGRAHAVLDLAVRHRVTGFTASVRPDPVMNMGLQLLSSRASLRNDLTAQRDLAENLRHKLAFWKEPKPQLGAESR